jgi:nucleotide-binding universal stress UspA family protein
MPRTILLPTDGSATAKAARRFAVDIAGGEGDSIVAFSVADRVIRHSPVPVVLVPLVGGEEKER